MLALAVYLPFEEFLLKFFPGSDKVVFATRFLSELAIYFLLAIVIADRFLKKSSLRKTPLDLPIFLFVGAALLSIVVNSSPLLGSFITLRALLRYVALFYAVVNIYVSRRQYENLLNVLLAVGVIQMSLGFMQALLGPGFAELFVPRATETAVGGVTKNYVLLSSGREAGSVFGTLGDTVLYGNFIVFVSVLAICKFARVKLPGSKTVWGFLSLLLLVAVGLSYSRASLLAFAVAWFVYMRVEWGRARTVLVISSTAAALAFVVLIGPAVQTMKVKDAKQVNEGIVKSFLGVFSSDYIEVAQKQRLGALIGNVPTVLVNRPVFGYGPDVDVAVEKINASQKSFLFRVWSVEGFKDVYWVALLTFYGLAGLSMLIWMFARLYHSAWEAYRNPSTPSHGNAGLVMIIMTMVTVFMLFFSQSLEFRTYSFYFWLWAALVYATDQTAVESLKRRAG